VLRLFFRHNHSYYSTFLIIYAAREVFSGSTRYKPDSIRLSPIQYSEEGMEAHHCLDHSKYRLHRTLSRGVKREPFMSFQTVLHLREYFAPLEQVFR